MTSNARKAFIINTECSSFDSAVQMNKLTIAEVTASSDMCSSWHENDVKTRHKAKKVSHIYATATVTDRKYIFCSSLQEDKQGSTHKTEKGK